MDLRLYKNCRLSSNYDEIIYPYTLNNVDVHAAYLATLDYVDVELDEVYLTREGTLSFAWDDFGIGPVHKYNYIKLSDDNMTIYAFITSSVYINGLATINYSTDIWSTYARYMLLGDSIMTATRFPRSDAPRSLPLAYVSNRWPGEIASNTSGNVGAIVQYQYYTLTGQGGPVTYRNIATALLTTPSDVAAGDYKTIVNRLLDLIAKSSEQRVSIGAASYYYEIGAAWILPAEWITEIKTEITAAQITPSIVIEANDQTLTPIYRLYHMDDITAGAEYVIAADPTIIGAGTHTNATPIIYNGLQHTVIIDIHSSPTDFTVDMEIDGGRSSITSDFELDIPIAAASAAETQQAKISRRLKEQQADARLWQTGFSIAGSVGQIAIGAASMATGAGAGFGISQVVQGVGSLGSGIMAINQINAERDALNAKVYATNSGTRCTKSPALNATRGFCQMQILPANAGEMTAAIEAQGYTVYYATSSLTPDATAPSAATLTTRRFDVLKYSFVRIIGGFTEEIKEALKVIMLNGARVWYVTPA